LGWAYSNKALWIDTFILKVQWLTLEAIVSRIQEGDYAREARVVLEKRKEIIAILKKHNAIHGIEVKGDLNKISKLREDPRVAEVQYHQCQTIRFLGPRSPNVPNTIQFQGEK
jgi:hypothetical protein